MDTIHNLCYTMGNIGGSYETPWQTPDFGKAAAPCHPLVETGPSLSYGSPGSARFFKFRGALAPELQEEGPQGVKTDSQYRTSFTSVGKTEEDFGEHPGKRASGSRLLNGSLDAETYRPDNPEEFSGALLYRKPVESDERPWLELSEATEARQGASGRGDSLLETSRLAAYKKRPLCLEPAWPSWMRADSRSFPISKEPGRSKEELQRSLSPDAGPRYRLSPPSLSLQKENGLDFTRVSTSIETSEPDKSDNSSDIFASISKVPSFFFGTEALFIKPDSSTNSLKNTLEFIPFTFRDTRPSLIPMNLSGQTSSEIWQTASLKTPGILDDSLTGRLEDSDIPRNSYGLASTRLTYRSHDVYPLFNESLVIPQLIRKQPATLN